MAKTRVAPLKPLTIPRLELQAAILAVRMSKTINKELEIEISRRVFWCDSKVVLHWIRSGPRTRQLYVANRLGEIAESSKALEWRWVPTKQNPADIATRWSKYAHKINKSWFDGPEFLKKTENCWPIESNVSVTEKERIDNIEKRVDKIYVVQQSTCDFPLVIKLLGLQRLLVMANRVRKAADRWSQKPRLTDNTENIKAAELFWVREIQSYCFTEELAAVKNNKGLKKSSKLLKYKPFLDEQGVLRADSRVKQLFDVADDYCNQPIILDSQHPATKLLIAEFHRKLYHANTGTVFNEIQKKYFIIGLRNALRSLEGKCLTCKLRRAKPKKPLMAALPPGRLAFRQRPFSHCGLDFFGPVTVKIGRRREKRWGVLFTCLTIRAMHVEIAHSLSTSSAIMAVQRFSARRGTPSVIYSDNGTNFRGACRELNEEIKALNREQLQLYASTNKIKWKFNSADAPHMGGAWERLVRSVKTALKVVLREQAPSEEVLHTLLVEIEHCINSRPLTYVSLDPRDQEALTPNHFLLGTSSGALRVGRYEMEVFNPRKQWKIAEAFADCFWKRWLREYLPTITSRAKWTKEQIPLKKGDLVLIMDMQAPRNTWKTGVISEIYPSSDGQVRVAKVKTASGEYKRPTRKLIQLVTGKLDDV